MSAILLRPCLRHGATLGIILLRKRVILRSKIIPPDKQPLKKYTVILLSLLWLFRHHRALADTFSPDCTTAQLIKAITAANLNSGADTIELPPNCVYNLTNSQNSYGGFGNNGLPPITDTLIINGYGATIQRTSAMTTFRLFYVTSAMTLSQVALQGGDSGNNDGGGIYNAAGAVLWVQQSNILSHQAGIAGGGIYNHANALLNLEQTTVAYNHAANGGGLYNDGLMNIDSSTLAYNQAITTGGGLRNTNGLVNISNSTFFDNSALNGGGLRNEAGQINLSNNSLVNNHATNFGGGVLNRSSFITQPAIITMSYTILASNTATTGAELRNQGAGAMVLADRYNLFGVNGVSNAAVLVTGNTDMTATVPITAILTPTLALNGVSAGLPPTLALVEGSPAITMGDTICVYFSNGLNPLFNDGETILTDQRLAMPRNVGGQCDVGAFEFGAIPPPLPVAPHPPMPVGGVAQAIIVNETDAWPYVAIFTVFLGILAYFLGNNE